MKAAHIALAIIGSAIVGAAAGLLCAPQSGKRTRRDIHRFVTEKCPEMGKDRLDEIVDYIENAIKH